MFFEKLKTLANVRHYCVDNLLQLGFQRLSPTPA